ncbi:YceD family protein [Geoalkalibacter halelectricus]|uniref:YceD family protein n=1 Tax=Geoalkalibacter halelectricus TaxID=2847045 RepID=UPI003D24DF0A
MNSLRVSVEKIKENEVALDIAETAESFPALEELIQRAECRFVGSITGRIRIYFANGFFEVEGQVAARVLLPCSRCLQEVETPLRADISATFASELPLIEGGESDEVELTAEDMGLLPVEGDEIDLREVIQEQIIMELPLRPLCGTDCRGICPFCGANLNDGDCGCRAPVFNNKFAALKDFRAEK